MFSNIACFWLKKAFVWVITEAAVQPSTRDWELTAMTKPGGKPVAEAAAFHSLFNWTANAEALLGQVQQSFYESNFAGKS